MLHALSEGMPAEKFGRVHHLPAAQLAAVVDGMRARGLIDPSGWLSVKGWETKERIEAVTDDLAAPPYDSLEPASSTGSSRTWSPSPQRSTPSAHARRRTSATLTRPARRSSGCATTLDS